VNWLVKAAVQKGVSALPAAERANYLFQRHVTRTLPIGEAGVARKLERALEHVRAYRRHGPGRPLGDAVFYEFGAGWDLAVPLAHAALGVGGQVLVDIRPNVRLELVNATLATLARRRAPLEEETGEPLRDLGPPDVGTLDELEGRFGISYLAPRDARRTGLPAASVDLVSSTNTLEHVPEGDIGPILAECARLLRPDGVMSFRIDMQDHASYSDGRVSAYNFLRFSDPAWRLVSSRLGYQNRLRLPDYRRIFREAGLEAVAENVTWPSDEDLAALERLDLAPRFRAYSSDELAARVQEVVLRPSLPDRAQERENVGRRGGARVGPRAGS
jgi:SAM-dependent methyltransferase